jgi:hypothetical protein
VKPVTVLMAFVLVIFLVIVNRDDRPSPSDRQRPVPTTRAPRPSPTTQRALPPAASVPVNRPAPLGGPAEDTTAIVASLVAVCLSGFAVAAFRRR